MSTKLYNAYKLPLMDIGEFFAMIENLKKEIRKTQMKLYQEEFLKRCLKVLDFKTFNPKGVSVFSHSYHRGDETMKIAELVNYWLEAEHKLTQAKNQMTFYYFHANFLFNNGQGYAIIRYLNNSQFSEVFESVSKAQLYEYYNNIDHPEELTKEDWDNRNTEWNEVFGNSMWDMDSAKNNLKLVCDFSPSEHRYNMAESPLLPSSKMITDLNRVREPAEEQLIKEKFPTPPSDYHEIFRYMTSDEFIAKRKIRAEELMNKVIGNPHLMNFKETEILVLKKYPRPKTEEVLDIDSPLSLI